MQLQLPMCVCGQSCCFGAICDNLCHKREDVKHDKGLFGGITFTVPNQLYGGCHVDSVVVALLKQNTMHCNRKTFIIAPSSRGTEVLTLVGWLPTGQ